jgi:hypothetical protein
MAVSGTSRSTSVAARVVSTPRSASSSTLAPGPVVGPGAALRFARRRGDPGRGK